MAQHMLYFTHGQLDDGRWIGIISNGSPQRSDDHVVVQDVHTETTQRAIMKWGKDVLKTKPWIPRS